MLFKNIDMKPKLIFLLTLFAKITTSQSLTVLPDSNYFWNVHYCCNPSTTRIYTIKDDTIIDSKSYKKVTYCLDSTYTINKAIYYGAIREGFSKKVYFKPSNETEDILYDFDLIVNDTFKTAYFKFVVDSITIININNNPKKKIFLHSINPGSNRPQEWIEGIGSSFGLVEVTATQAGDISTDLLCFYHIDTLIYSLQNSCYINTVGVAEKLKSDFKVKIFPNPSYNQKISLQFPEIGSYCIKILDLLGNVIYSEATFRTELIIDDLPKGMYVISVIDAKNNQRIFNKFLIE